MKFTLNQYNAVIGATPLWGFGVKLRDGHPSTGGKVSQHQPHDVSHRVFCERLRGHCDVSKIGQPRRIICRLQLGGRPARHGHREDRALL